MVNQIMIVIIIIFLTVGWWGLSVILEDEVILAAIWLHVYDVLIALLNQQLL